MSVFLSPSISATAVERVRRRDLFGEQPHRVCESIGSLITVLEAVPGLVSTDPSATSTV
ncbi:MAG TPA: hypothetical protein VIZ91_08535 [Solirubrobacterales bacterium]